MRSLCPVQRLGRIIAALGGMAILASPPVSALDWTASVAVTTDYLVRGLTRSAGDPALQGHLGLTGERHWAAGVWASTVKLYDGPGPRNERDYYLTAYLPLGHAWRLSGQLTRYEFDRDSALLTYDYTELAAALTYRDWLSMSVAVSPDYSFYSARGSGIRETALTWELEGRYPLSRHLRLCGGIGRSDPGGAAGLGYWYWSGGGEIAWRNVSVGFSYVGTDERARRLFREELARDAWVATLVLRLH